MVLILLRITSALSGLLLIGWSAFLYEQEETEIDNTLMTWWIKVDDAAKAAMKVHLSFAQRVAAVVTKWLDDLFESRLISPEAIAISACLSASSGFLFLLIWFIYSPDLHTVYAATTIVSLCAILSVAYFGIAVSRQRGELYTATLSILALFALAATLGVLSNTIVPLLGLTLGISCDFLLIVLSRRSAKWVAAGATTLTSVIAAVLNATAAVAFLCYPFFLPHQIAETWLGVTLQTAAATNIFGAVVSIMFLVVAITLLTHRVFWPLLERPLYAMHRFHLFSVGAFCSTPAQH